jgi:hypothetical protein
MLLQCSAPFVRAPSLLHLLNRPCNVSQPSIVPTAYPWQSSDLYNPYCRQTIATRCQVLYSSGKERSLRGNYGATGSA